MVMCMVTLQSNALESAASYYVLNVWDPCALQSSLLLEEIFDFLLGLIVRNTAYAAATLF